MKYFIPRDVVITDSSIPENTDVDGNVYPEWEVKSYMKDAIVGYKGSLYKAYTNIYPLATYSWNDISSSITAEIIRLIDNVQITPTAVPCIKDVTVVYIIDTWTSGRETVIGKYFQYIGTTGDVDFTTIHPDTHTTHFKEINNYTNEINIPNEQSLYWKYLGKTNRNRAADKSYNQQSIAKETTEAWWEFEALTPDRIVLFNIQAKTAKVTIYENDINDPVYEYTIADLIDTTSIINWRTLVRYRNVFAKTANWDVPFLTGRYTVRITLSNPSPIDLKLGEILYGYKNEIGLTLDGIPTQLKSSAQITEKENGEIFFQDEGNKAKVYAIFNFSLVYDSIKYDMIMDKCTELINRRVVVIGENSDKPQFRNLTIYGFIRDASPSLTTNATKSDIQIQIQRFI